jgi:hypothetical protein
MSLQVRYGRTEANVGTEFPCPLRPFGGCTPPLSMGDLPSQQSLPAARQHTTTPRHHDRTMASTSLHLHDMQELALETTCAIFWYSTSRSHCTAHPQRPSHDTMHDGQNSRYCCTCLCIYSNRTSTSTLKRTHHPPSCQVLAQVLDQCLPSH